MLILLLAFFIGAAFAQGDAPATAPAAQPASVPAPPPVDGGGAPVAAAQPLPAARVVDRVAAVVNDDIVLLSEIYAFGGPYVEQVVAQAGESGRAAAEGEVLERLLERRLVEQEMRTLQLDLSDQDVERSMADIAERNGLDMDGLRREIEMSGMPWEQYRSELKESLRDMRFAQSVLRPRINITEDELRDAWLRSGAAAPASARLQALVLAFPPGASDADREAVLARARTLRDQANAGADFAALSKEHDQGPFGAQGGDMGVFKPGELVDALDAVVRASPVGQVAEPIVIGDGVYLLRVAERLAGDNDFESRRDELAEIVFQSRIEDERARWFQEARRRATVRIVLPGLAAAPAGR